MKALYKIKILVFVVVIFYACNTKEEKTNSTIKDRETIEMVTDYGSIVIELYNETPKHRDNFIKIVNEGVLDSLLFHRVINQFMIQSGDTDSKYAKSEDTLGSGDLDYNVDAEFHPDLFHKKGVLAAARDNHPERASSSTQFYIVQGKVYNDSLLDYAQGRINGWLAQHYSNKDPKNKSLIDSLQKTIDNQNWERYAYFNDSLRSLAKSFTNFEKYSIPEEHTNVYKSIGGTPHLDQNYTVFGEVIKGLEIIDSIAAIKTNQLDRPLIDVRIQSVKVLTKD
jgi:cyclophilin family peptidyl-prolyl cis-trans isomerase